MISDKSVPAHRVHGRSSIHVRGLAGILLGLAGLCMATAALADPSGRVARLNYLAGEVSFAPAGEDYWSEASLNRPLVSGDRILTEPEARAALEIGGAEIRLDERSGLKLLNLDDRNTRVQLSSGTAILSLRRLDADQHYQIDTPTIALVIEQPGEYRVDIARDGAGTVVSVQNGAGTVYGAGQASYGIGDHQSYRFDDPRLRDVAIMPLPRPDAFDRWSQARDERARQSVAERYASPYAVGLRDLDDYGDWREEAGYGYVWYPTTLVIGWAPYRFGHWLWIPPWGWTWVDDEPWGFAPSHYGRWLYLRDSWGWVPCPVQVRPVYSPALVVFVGSGQSGVPAGPGTAPVGWFPLGPRDVYVPPYRASRNYFTNVNVSNLAQVNQGELHNYYNNAHARRGNANSDYAYRHQADALTIVTRDTFTRSRPVGGAQLPGTLLTGGNAPVSVGAPAAPSRESRGLRPTRPQAGPPSQMFGRPPGQPPREASPGVFAEPEHRGRENPGRDLSDRPWPVQRGVVETNPAAPAGNSGGNGRTQSPGEAEDREQRPGPYPSRRFAPREQRPATGAETREPGGFQQRRGDAQEPASPIPAPRDVDTDRRQPDAGRVQRNRPPPGEERPGRRDSDAASPRFQPAPRPVEAQPESRHPYRREPGFEPRTQAQPPQPAPRHEPGPQAPETGKTDAAKQAPQQEPKEHRREHDLR